MIPDSDGRSADSFDGDLDEFDPAAIGSADRARLAPVWKRSDILRQMLEERRTPSGDDRDELKGHLISQLPTIYLYWKMTQVEEQARKYPEAPEQLSLYIILFPGEARDNTGVKDLNDNVIGQWWNAQYQQRRYDVIRELLNTDGFIVAAQTYKTAFIITLTKTRKDFVAKLKLLDEKLKDELLKILEQAAVDNSVTDKQKAQIPKLRKALSKKGYRFDIFFGLRSLSSKDGSLLAKVYLLVTEAMKGAALSRYAAKATALQTRIAKQLAAQPRVSADEKKLDPRGKEYDWKVYLRASALAPTIKDSIVKGELSGTRMELNAIYVNTAWTFAFVAYQNLYWGNPEVVRDVRKKKLERALIDDGNVTTTFRVQKDLLELWLVILNMIDYVKSFESAEFDNRLLTYHDKARSSYHELARPDPEFGKAFWDNLQFVLTHDVRQHEPIAVIATASEYQFYATISDHQQRIIFSLDIRDMGVELMLLYEDVNLAIVQKRLSDLDLMKATFRVTDPIDVRRRATYDVVIAMFRKYYEQLQRRPVDSASAARQFFDGEFAPLGSFEQAVQFMLGGDELYIAAHPFFAAVTPTLLGELDKATFAPGRRVDLRASVAFSDAAYAPADDQRETTQLSHQDALKHADLAPGTLKELERLNSRILRLIEMLEANPEKKSRGPGYRAELAKLPLQQLFARWKAGWRERSQRETAKLYAELLAGGVTDPKEDPIELVDFTGTIVDKIALLQAASSLEKKVRKDVGADNRQVHPMPLPPQKLIEKIIDLIVWEDPDWKDPWKKKPPAQVGP